MSNKEIKMLKANFEHMLTSPLFVNLQKKIKKLEDERKILRRVILELGSKLESSSQKENVIDISSDNDEYPENIKYELEDTVVPVLNENVKTHKTIIKLEDNDTTYEVTEHSKPIEWDYTHIKKEVSSNFDKHKQVEEEEEEEEDEEEEVEVEEEEEEEVEEEEEEVEEEEEEVEEEEEEEEEDEDEEEVFEVTIKGKKYYTTDTVNGEIYDVLDDEEIGDVVGHFKKGIARFN